MLLHFGIQHFELKPSSNVSHTSNSLHILQYIAISVDCMCHSRYTYTIEKLQFSPIWGLMKKQDGKKPSANRWMKREYYYMIHGYFATHFIIKCSTTISLHMELHFASSFFSCCSWYFRVSSLCSCDFSQPHIKHLWTNQLSWCWYSAIENI